MFFYTALVFFLLISLCNQWICVRLLLESNDDITVIVCITIHMRSEVQYSTDGRELDCCSWQMLAV